MTARAGALIAIESGVPSEARRGQEWGTIGIFVAMAAGA
jgi:hypothetical protein